jgi:2-polyprenyl-3-methyl-5-hydroxy-6-metoxy-1,4-benzoquinol methylase
MRPQFGIGGKETQVDNAKNQVNTACECCGVQKSAQISEKRGWKILQCSHCGLFFVCPQPTSQQLTNFYNKSSGYFATAESDLSKTSPDASKYLHKLFLSTGMKPGKLLDVGCSTGRLIYHLKNMGWQVTGIEVNADSVDIAKKNNLDVSAGELEEGQYQKSSFDVILLGDVIEHVRTPRQLLTLSYDLLREGGFLFINTPNAQSGFATSSLLLSKLLNFPWPHSEAPYHLYEFSPETLSRLLSSIGYDIFYLRYKGSNTFSYIVGATGIFDDLKASMKQAGRYKFNIKFLRKIPILALISCILLPFYIFGKLYDKLLHSGSKFHVIARKVSRAVNINAKTILVKQNNNLAEVK